ncbi:hypothetical protein CWO91_33005 [Bradyrhizobium genosp. SA-3]|uniref:hypothetical protein n=1 Tax=Bradyrhizobium genosp. SA-3 TaxID=508868 RepID=UPI001029AA6C|nr:hypothetical protein [Bradyrhizobium genosp. SA-3]RZN01681.1 hypothetical protein CWO91_33005 [Bradyrhizobium genosp. SA-3]
MLQYRAYILDSGGHITARVDLICKNEKDAEEHAWSLAASDDVELWQEDRQLAIFRHRAPLVPS